MWYVGTMHRAARHFLFPQKSNNHRARILHVEGIAVLTVIVLVGQILTHSFSTYPGPLPAILGFSSSITTSQVVEQTNQQRASVGLSTLSSNAQLSAAAAAKGNHMCAEQYWAHISPSGVTPWVFMKNAGYKYSVAGENLARDFADTGSMVSAWMASPTHKANIVNPKYSEIGVAVIDCKLLGTDTALVVQMFGTQVVPAVAAARESASLPRAGQVEAQTSQVAPQEIEQAKPALPVEAPIEEEQVAGEESVPKLLVDVDPSLTLSTPEPVSSLPHLFTPLQVSKAIMVSVLGILLVVLFVDMWFSHEKQTVRIAGRNLAHMLFLSGVLIVIIILKAGVTL